MLQGRPRRDPSGAIFRISDGGGGGGGGVGGGGREGEVGRSEG
jgi:hypothetical protein